MIKATLKRYKLQLKQVPVLKLKIENLEKLNAGDDLIETYKKLLTKIEFELQEFDMALEGLEDDEAYLVKEQCIIGRPWSEISMSYNKIFKNKPQIDIDGLRKKKDKALRDLKEFYEPILELEGCVVNA